MKSFIRYPGGKAKMSDLILPILERQGLGGSGIEYRDPFFGGGGLGLVAMARSDSAWINDADPGMASLWTAVFRHSDELINLVNNFIPSVGAYNDYKQSCKSLTEFSESMVVEAGFRKLALHQMSYSGLGSMSGGPIGGVGQKSKYDVGCRWSPSSIIKKIKAIKAAVSGVKIKGDMCFCGDFSELIGDDGESVLYADPPYYEQGPKLYQVFFTDEDHKRLADSLKDRIGGWVLSYDNSREIISMYERWSSVGYAEVGYSITAIKNIESGTRLSTRKQELIIRKADKDV